MSQKKLSILKTIALLTALPLTVYGIKKVIDIRKDATGYPANIVVDASTNQGKIPNSLWQNFSQGGEEAKDMIGPVALTASRLQPKIIRLDHLFDYYGVYIGPGTYDFSRLDQAVLSVMATGAKPMLSVSYTPANMTKNGQVAGEPNDWHEWSNLVQATAKHYSLDKKISGIYYEIWNEPDLFGAWHYSKSPSYTQLYTVTAKAIATGAQNSLYKIGGPGTTAFYVNWIQSLLKTVTDNKLPLDFISWHHYSKDITSFTDDIDALNNILASYPQFTSVERIMSEVGPNSEPDPWYDTKIGGIHLMAITNNLAGKIHKIFSFELVDGPVARPNNSLGWGLISHPLNGAKPKPRFFAIQFLNLLQGNRLALSGNGSWVSSLASGNNGVTQVLMVNYDPRNAHAETFPLTINNLKPGKYQLKQTFFMGAPSSQREIYLATNYYSTNIYLDPNSATLLELVPQP